MCKRGSGSMTDNDLQKLISYFPEEGVFLVKMRNCSQENIKRFEHFINGVNFDNPRFTLIGLDDNFDLETLSSKETLELLRGISRHMTDDELSDIGLQRKPCVIGSFG
jgi:hypothetical protein